MTNEISGKSILVTRPEKQANHLCDLIEKLGGKAIRFPVIEIKAIVTSGTLKERFNTITKYDYVIFVSQNAVSIAFDHYLSHFDVPCKTQFVAIGKSTAKLLEQYGITHVLYPDKDADSESLLLLPEFTKEKIKDKSILIVRGEGGRELLADSLRQRGAYVDYIEVYQRCLPHYDMSEKQKLWQDVSPDAIIITSNEGLKNLFILTLDKDKEKLLQTPLVVMSARTIAFAKQQGFVSTIIMADEKSDEGLLSALIDVIGD